VGGVDREGGGKRNDKKGGGGGGEEIPVLEGGADHSSLPFVSLLGLFLLGHARNRAPMPAAHWLADCWPGRHLMRNCSILRMWPFTWYVIMVSIVTFVTGRRGQPLAPVIIARRKGADL